MSDRKRVKQPPPSPDDPRFERICTRCGTKRQWVVCICPACHNPEFTVPEAALCDEEEECAKLPKVLDNQLTLF